MPEMIDEQPDTQVADTESVDIATMAAPPLAWSVSDNEPLPPAARWRYWLRWVVLAVLVGVLSTVIVWLVMVPGSKRPVAATLPPVQSSAVLPSPVSAPPPMSDADRDDSYIALLDKSAAADGREHYYTTREGAIRFGRSVCAVIQQGAPSVLGEQALARTRPDLTAQQRMIVVGLAVSVYCPELIGK
jgi:hypothetical protein